MNIKTKYEVGTHIWVVYENRGEVHIYDDYLSSIGWEGYLFYITKESCEELKEENVILYEETDKLAEKIKQLMLEIREKEGSKDE